MAPALDALRKARPDLPVVYSAHNVESRLKTELLRAHPQARNLISFIGELERRLAEQAQLIVCCTEADAAHFAAGGAPVALAANGCAAPSRVNVAAAAEPAGRPRVGFLGSSHGPNVAAADHIVGVLAPLFPDVRFELLGSVCSALTVAPPDNVVLHGVAPEGFKSWVLGQWSLALNPLLGGGGSSLKLPDYMIHGLPSLNTPEGARGFAVEERGAGRVAALEDFPALLAEMLAAAPLLEDMGARARAYAESELTWAAAVRDYRAALRALMRPPAPRAPRRLLVVTYRYTEPTLGGAEEYLIEALKRLRGRFDRIDLAAVDIERIENRHHFGCQLSDGPGAAGRLGELFDSAHYFPCEEIGDEEMLERARDLERVWGSEEFHLLAPFARLLADPGALKVFSGFFAPENHGGAIKRWTAPDFSFLLPPDARLFQMEGYAGRDKALSAVLIQIPRAGAPATTLKCQLALSANFSVTLALPAAQEDCVRILLCKAEEHQAPGDHRPFGVFVEAASALCGDLDSLSPMAVRRADLAEIPGDRLRSSHFDAWVDSLRRIAVGRESEIDAAFGSVRGPHSPAMQAWLAEHGGDYDCVLVQGIPFDVIPASTATLNALPRRPRIVTLPHFHGDDRFYHWKIYFDAFARADSNLLFSPSLARKLGRDANFAVVPGGGVRIEDMGGPGAEAAFRAVCPATNPFFLVLGRKTGSKGYGDILDAHRALRATRDDIDLVLIGPDDDGQPIGGEGVHYLGRQSREAVRGALAACLGLVTMSRSESFGIVLCEGWLFGKPVIANAHCYSFRDLVRHGETGLLVDGVEDLAQAMVYLADDAPARARMGRAGFVGALEHFSWEQVADAIDANL